MEISEQVSVDVDEEYTIARLVQLLLIYRHLICYIIRHTCYKI